MTQITMLSLLLLFGNSLLNVSCKPKSLKEDGKKTASTTHPVGDTLEKEQEFFDFIYTINQHKIDFSSLKTLFLTDSKQLPPSPEGLKNHPRKLTFENGKIIVPENLPLTQPLTEAERVKLKASVTEIFGDISKDRLAIMLKGFDDAEHTRPKEYRFLPFDDGIYLFEDENELKQYLDEKELQETLKKRKPGVVSLEESPEGAKRVVMVQASAEIAEDYVRVAQAGNFKDAVIIRLTDFQRSKPAPYLSGRYVIPVGDNQSLFVDESGTSRYSNASAKIVELDLKATKQKLEDAGALPKETEKLLEYISSAQENRGLLAQTRKTLLEDWALNRNLADLEGNLKEVVQRGANYDKAYFLELFNYYSEGLSDQNKIDSSLYTKIILPNKISAGKGTELRIKDIDNLLSKDPETRLRTLTELNINELKRHGHMEGFEQWRRANGLFNETEIEEIKKLPFIADLKIESPSPPQLPETKAPEAPPIRKKVTFSPDILEIDSQGTFDSKTGKSSQSNISQQFTEMKKNKNKSKFIRFCLKILRGRVCN